MLFPRHRVISIKILPVNYMIVSVAKFLVVFWVTFRFHECVRLGSISSEIELSHTNFWDRTQSNKSNPIVRLSSIEFDYRTVRLVTSGKFDFTVTCY